MTALYNLFEIQRKPYLMATFKLHEYHTFCLMKMNNMTKICFVNNKFSLWKSLVYN